MRRAFLKSRLSLLLLLLSSPALAAEEPPSPVPPDEILEAEGAVIGSIDVRVEDIFDTENPKEDHQLYRLTNRLHRTTRPSVIEGQLLFKSGDRYSRHQIDESERLLRQERYLHDPKIHAVRYRDGRVDLEVVVRDLWTTNAGVSFGRKGGSNSTSLQLQDTNFLGTGKSLTLVRQSDVDRTSSQLGFVDPNLLGRRLELNLGYSANSDGNSRLLSLERPFYSLDTRQAAGIKALSDDRIGSLYQAGHISEQFQHRQSSFTAYGGLSRGLVGDRVHRWTAGYSFVQNRFTATPGAVFPTGLPAERTLSYPWVAFDSLADDFRKTSNFNQMGRTEDLSLGRRFRLQLGWSSPLWGADSNEAIFAASAGFGMKPGEARTLLFSSSTEGRWGREGARNLRLGGRADYYQRDFGDHLFLGSLSADAVENLDAENQLLLGGDNGLRGYPLRYQDGDRRFLLTLEQRFFTRFYPFRLAHVGAAVFFDAGQAWWQDTDPHTAAAHGLLKDIGVGLRLSNSRSGLGSVTHIDIAFPLDGDGSIRRVQYLVSTKAGF